MRTKTWSVLAVLVILAASCSTESASDESTTTTVPQTTTTTTVPWSDVPATEDTVMVYGQWANTTLTETGREFSGGVEKVTLEYSEMTEMSDSRASGTIEYVTTLYIPDTDIGGTWVIEEVMLVNAEGTWTGHGTGAYIYADNMPDALTSSDHVIIGEWHFVGDGAYEGLRLDLYSSSDGIIGTINPIG